MRTKRTRTGRTHGSGRFMEDLALVKELHGRFASRGWWGHVGEAHEARKLLFQACQRPSRERLASALAAFGRMPSDMQAAVRLGDDGRRFVNAVTRERLERESVRWRMEELAEAMAAGQRMITRRYRKDPVIMALRLIRDLIDVQLEVLVSSAGGVRAEIRSGGLNARSDTPRRPSIGSDPIEAASAA